MAVMGLPFIFNDVPSEFYGCSIVFIEEDPNKRTSGDGRTFTTIKPLRSAKQSVLDVQVDQPLTFGIEIAFDEPVDIHTLTAVKSWLASPLGFRKLQVCSDLFDQYYWNCYITLNNDLIYAGGYRGVTATVTCDAPWAWGQVRTIQLSGSTTKWINVSEETEPMKPVLEFVATNGANLIIEIYNENLTYDKTFMIGAPNAKLSNTQKNGVNVDYTVPSWAKDFNSPESVSLDNSTGIFTCRDASGNLLTKMYRTQSFNKQLLKIPQGIVYIKVTSSGISNLKIKYQNVKRIGGGFYQD